MKTQVKFATGWLLVALASGTLACSSSSETKKPPTTATDAGATDGGSPADGGGTKDTSTADTGKADAGVVKDTTQPDTTQPDTAGPDAGGSDVTADAGTDAGPALSSDAAAYMGAPGKTTTHTTVIPVITTDKYITADQMLLANEINESGEPFAEALGYNLDKLDPMVAGKPDATAYILGIENYEYSRYQLGTVISRSGIGLHMMWAPLIMQKAAMEPASFDGSMSGGKTNGFKEDDELKKMIKMFATLAKHAPPGHPWPQFAEFQSADPHLPQKIDAKNFAWTDFLTLRWDRSKMNKVLNPASMGQTLMKQYLWAQDMLSGFHDKDDNGIDADGVITPDKKGSAEFDPTNNVFYGGSSLDGFIGMVLTAEAINKIAFIKGKLAYDGTKLGGIDLATYDPKKGIKYFPHGVSVTESMVKVGLPPKVSALKVTDASSVLWDQVSLLWGVSSFVNMMDPSDTSDSAHKAYKAVFDGSPFPAPMSVTKKPGPYDLMKGTARVIFLNLKAMHADSANKVFVDTATLKAGKPVLGDTVSTVASAYLIVALDIFAEELVKTPLQAAALAAIKDQATFLTAQLSDGKGLYADVATLSGGSFKMSGHSLASQAAAVRGLYVANRVTGDAAYLTAANAAYVALIKTYHVGTDGYFRTMLPTMAGSGVATFTPKNVALLSGALREAALQGKQKQAAAIYTEFWQKVVEKMQLSEGANTGETGNDSDGDGIPFIPEQPDNLPPVFASEAAFHLATVTTTKYITADQMLLANEINESGEPFAEALGYNLDKLDPMVAGKPDATAYILGIENYEYSRYQLGTVISRSGIGLHMMWAPLIMQKAAMEPASFDGSMSGGKTNGFKEDDELKKMIKMFATLAKHAPPGHPWPQFAEFQSADPHLPQKIDAKNFAWTDFLTLRWARNKMDKILNPAGMGQTLMKQYLWAQDMLSGFHDKDDNGIDADGVISPDKKATAQFDPSNNVFYGGSSLDGFIGMVLTAEAINKVAFIKGKLAYDGTKLGGIDLATYNPKKGIQYFPHGVGVTEKMVKPGLPPRVSGLKVTDASSVLWDQVSLLWGISSFVNMMDPSDTSDSAHKAYKAAFDGSPFPAPMSVTKKPGPYDLMKGTARAIFLNLKAMHADTANKVFVDTATLKAGKPVRGDTVSTVASAYLIVALEVFTEEFVKTPLQAAALATLKDQATFLTAHLSDGKGLYADVATLKGGAFKMSGHSLSGQAAAVRGLYVAARVTGDAVYLTAANKAYAALITTYHAGTGGYFRTMLATVAGSGVATFTPKNVALLSGALREAALQGKQKKAAAIYTEFWQKVVEKMQLSEGASTGETGKDSDGDGIPFIPEQADGLPPVFASQAAFHL